MLQAYEEAVLKECGETWVDVSKVPSLFTTALAKAGAGLRWSTHADCLFVNMQAQM